MSNPSAPALSRFQFNTIGKPPSLLQRLAEPGAAPSNARLEPFPSPLQEANVSEPPPAIPPLNRPSLLEQLTGDRNASSSRPSESPTTELQHSAVGPGVRDIFKVTLSSSVDAAKTVGPSPGPMQAPKPTATMSTFCLSLPPEPEAPSPFTSAQLDLQGASSSAAPAATTVNHFPLASTASTSTSVRPSSSPNLPTLPLPSTLSTLTASSLTTADLYRHIAELSDERMELQEARFARQRVADEHREYLRRHVEAQAAAEREKEQMGKLVGAVQEALDKTVRVRERQEKRWTEENMRMQRAVRAMEEEEERKRGEQEAEAAAAIRAKAEAEERAKREAEEAEAREKAAVDEKAKAAEAEAKAKAAAQAQAEAEAKDRARVEQEKQERLRQEEKEKQERDRLLAMAAEEQARAEAEAEMARALAAKARQAAEEKLRAEVKAKAQAAAAERLRADAEAKKRAEVAAAAKQQAAESAVKTQADQTAANDAAEVRKPTIVKAEPLPSPVSKLSADRAGAPKQTPQLPVTREGAATAANGAPNRSLPPTASSVQATSPLPVLGLSHPAENNITRPATQPARLQSQTATKARQQLPNPQTHSTPTTSMSGGISAHTPQTHLSTQPVQSHRAASDAPAQTHLRQEELRAQLLEKKQETKPPSGVSVTPSLGPKRLSREGVASSPPTSSLKIARSVWPPVSSQPVSSGMSYAASNATATQPQFATPTTTHIETRNVPTSIRSVPSNQPVKETEPVVQVKAEPQEMFVPPKPKEKPAPPVPRVEQQPPPQTAPAVTAVVPPLASLPPKPAVPPPAPRPPKPNAATSKTVQPPPPSHNHNVRNGDKSGRLPPANVVLDTGRNLAAPMSQLASAGSNNKPARSADNHGSSWHQASHAQWRTDQDDDGWVTTPRDEFDRPEQSYRSPTPERRYDHYSPSPERQSMRRPDYYPPPRQTAMRDRFSPASRKRMRDMYSEDSSYYKRPRYDNQPRSRSPYTSRRSDRAYTPPSPPVRYKSPPPPPQPRHRSLTPPPMARYSPARALSPYRQWSPRRASLSPQLPKPRVLAPPPPSIAPPVTMPERRNVDYAPSTEEPHRPNAKVPVVTPSRKAAPQVQQAQASKTDNSPVWRAEKPTPVPIPQSRTDLLSRMSDVPQYDSDGVVFARSDVPRARRGNPKGRGRGGSAAIRGGGGSGRLADRFQDRPQPQKDLESRISTW